MERTPGYITTTENWQTNATENSTFNEFPSKNSGQDIDDVVKIVIGCIFGALVLLFVW